MTGDRPIHRPRLEVWGGVECSVVRLRRGRDDQLARSGHDGRLEDLDRIAGLGLRALRCPVLWEHHGTHPIDWRRSDAYLQRVRDLGLRPIVGLLHHGCGPLSGGFLDPRFVSGLSHFAREVARRYPWIDDYTPVNEPLTTARFSGLYGLWHPFASDVRTFARVFLNQAHAIRAAMRAIREINPAARLIQTEDLGKVHSTPALRGQADFENERRWLTFDLLGGRLAPGGMMYAYLLDAGADARELEGFRSEPEPPDVLGMNHYVTSERFLDENLQNYPPCHHGGNGRMAYADVPAVRVRTEGAAGPANLLRELWQRYHQPIAITEVHLACTRDEQLRWLQEVWQAAQLLRAEGADVRAVTAWALLGAFDWDSLLLRADNHYECGAFDLRGGSPRPTAITAALRALAKKGKFTHPAATGPGWWRRPTRFAFPPVSAPSTGPGTAVWGQLERRSSLMISCVDPVLANAFAQACEERHLPVLRAPGAADTLPESSERSTPWAVIDVDRQRLISRAQVEPAHPLARDGADLRLWVDATLDKLIDAAAR